MLNQQRFIRLARRELGLTNESLAETLGVSPRTVTKWLLPSASADFRAMPRMALNFISQLLLSKKASLLAEGRRADAEVIDAILTLPRDGKELLANLEAFDRLQRSALFPHWERLPERPFYFERLGDKNEWMRREELMNARKMRASTR